MPGGLQIEVISSNPYPQVGDTVTYTVNSVGETPSGNFRPLTEFGFSYRYRYGVKQLVEGNWEYVVDPAGKSFQTSNVFEVTFLSSNEYKVEFELLEMYPFTDTDGTTEYFSASAKGEVDVLPKDEPQTPPGQEGEQPYPLDNIAQQHGGAALTLCINGRDCYPDASGSYGGIELKEGESLLVTACEYNLPLGSDAHSAYPTGMYVYSLEKKDGSYALDRVSGLDNLLSYGGSSIRISGNKGIRLITGIDSSLKSALTGGGASGYTLEEYGTLLCWASEMQNGSLSLADSYARHNYAYSRSAGADPVFRVSGGKVQYTNVLVGFTNEQCVEDIVMRPYIKLTDPDGAPVTLYGGIVRRSIGYIAYQNRNAFAPGNAAYSYIWDIIHFVYGDQFDADYRG